MINPAPTNGRKVTSESSGQWLMALSPGDQVPGDQRDDADQHGKGIMVDIARLQPTRLARQFAGRGGDAVRSEAVDDRPVAGLPQPIAEAERAAYEEPVVELVE